ncbi:hypothetical protein [Brevibacterium yomogidense]|uniref:hypothetical protein n=1 Tax=Brevibacterium yomogidense TaxID=946573 RepID=UPI0018DFD8F0|nr:hypothetical protein [Brevibacterium yomogidense]
MRTFLTALAERRHPVLRWEDSAGASLELTGPVLANWAHKAHGLLADSDVGPDLDLGVVEETGAEEPGVHWRALAGALAAWSLGACVRVIDEEEPDAPWAALVSEHRADDAVTHSADEVFIYPVAPLALGVDAPQDTIDFATALRAYPDEAPIGTTARVTFGDAAHTETEGLRALCGAPSAQVLSSTAPPGDASASAAPADGPSATPSDSPSTAAEVVVTSAPRTASDWGRIMHGLLHGVVVLRPAVDP